MKWTLVTGGSKGLGLALCLHFAKEGYPVLIHYRSDQKAADEALEACQNYGAEAELIQGDFSTVEGINNFIGEITSRFPKIKNLIHNAGPYFVASPLNTPASVLDELFNANLRAPFQIIPCLIDSITQSKGSIINIGIAGLEGCRSDIYSTAYMIAKGGLLQLTKSLAKELASKRVRVNMVSPGYLENSIDRPEDLTELPLGRLVTFEEVIRVVSFLMAPESEAITGQNIEVAGGVRL